MSVLACPPAFHLHPHVPVFLRPVREYMTLYESMKIGPVRKKTRTNPASLSSKSERKSAEKAVLRVLRVLKVFFGKKSQNAKFPEKSVLGFFSDFQKKSQNACSRFSSSGNLFLGSETLF